MTQIYFGSPFAFIDNFVPANSALMLSLYICSKYNEKLNENHFAKNTQF